MLRPRHRSSFDLSKMAYFCVGKYSNLRNSSSSRPSSLHKNMFLFGERFFGCSSFAACSLNGGFGRKPLNWQGKRSLSSLTAHMCDHVAFLDSSPQSNGLYGSRISRTLRVDTQNMLFEYLHGTRGLSFPDAEHISKNSPNFLQKLLTKFVNDQDANRSIARFLRFNPINEFEPFFESLGLKRSELHLLLPRDLIYLSDDDVLLENYHVLCNYGVPRSKIGKMYKEATEMFRYDYGVLSLKLMAYEKLGLSRPTIIKLVTCCPALLVGDVNAEFLRVLDKLKSLGIEVDWLRGCLSDKSVYNWNRILEMLNFLDRMGCEELASLMGENPRFVFDDSGKMIYVSVAMLLKLGLKMNMILKFFVQHHRILAGRFTEYLLNSMHFLYEIGMEAEDITKIVSTHPQVFGSCSSGKPEAVFAGLNISAESLRERIMEDPSQFGNLICRKKITVANLPKVEGTYLQEKTNFLLKLGFVENSDEMAKAQSKFRGRGDQLQERFNCLVKTGLDYHTVTEMIKQVPQVLNQSTNIIERKINYLLNHLGYPLEALVSFPTFLCYNMEKINLRFSMLAWLRERGIVSSTKNRKIVNATVALSTILAISDARFVKYFVSLHPEGSEEWERLKKSSSS